MMLSMANDKPLLARLLLKPGVTLAIVNAPKGQAAPTGAELVTRGRAEAVLLYARDEAELAASLDKARTRLADDGRLWIAYPKAGQLDTDLNRDRLAALVGKARLEPCRQVAVDATWSALWVKPIA
jgi:hypothetical protein